MSEAQRRIFVALLLCVPITGLLVLWLPEVGGTPLDTLAGKRDVIAHLRGMSDAQKQSHFWMTFFLDMPFLVSYGTVFVLTPWTQWGRGLRWFAALAAIVPAADLLENFAQMLALHGHYELLALKAWATPLKYYGFIPVALVCLLTFLFEGHARRGRG
jgi:hypothetical protein